MRSYTPLIPIQLLRPNFGFLHAPRLHKYLDYIKSINVYKISLRTLIIVGIIDICILPVLFIKIYYYPSLISVEAAPQAQAMLPDVTGPATSELIHTIEQTGFIVSPVMEISRPPFAVRGRIITLGNDNIQAFEYADVSAANHDFDTYSKKYVNSYRHIYVKDNLIALYIGNEQNIVDSLNVIFEKK